MVGDAYLVAPVMTPGASTATVYLPAGLWRHWWTNATYGSLDRGTTVTLPAPLGQPPAFISASPGTVTGEPEEGDRFTRDLLHRLQGVPGTRTVLPDTHAGVLGRVVP